MTDRYFALTVLLSQETRDDDAEPIIAAIRMIKGVLDVQPQVADVQLYYAQAAARRDLEQRLWQALREEPDKR
jgi:hypothetical protein